MAMTKKERAEVDAQLKALRHMVALRWTEPVLRDVLPPQPGDRLQYTEGWDYNLHTKTVYLGWSTCVSHGDGPAPSSGQRHASGSQRSREYFSTKERALKALRYAIEYKAAEDLAEVDRKIEAELNDTPTSA